MLLLPSTVSPVWFAVLGGAAIMPVIGGEDALSGLQSITIVASLPFLVVMLALMVALMGDLRADPWTVRRKHAAEAVDYAVVRACALTETTSPRLSTGPRPARAWGRGFPPPSATGAPRTMAPARRRPTPERCLGLSAARGPLPVAVAEGRPAARSRGDRGAVQEAGAAGPPHGAWHDASVTDDTAVLPSRLRLRALSATDSELLVTATLGNMNWCGERFTRDDVVGRPELARYTCLVPERGDVGVVAEDPDTGDALGVAWAQRLPADDPGYGFIDADTPEASLWVAPSARGRGVGRALMRALLRAAAEAGATRVSLSVEDGNDVAKGLYRSQGFVGVPGREADGVMLLVL